MTNNVVIQNGATIGNGVILNPGVEIHHESMVGNQAIAQSGTFLFLGRIEFLTAKAGKGSLKSRL